MAQYDVYANPNEVTRDSVPFVVDLQHDLLEAMATRVVAPLRSTESKTALAGTLMPRFQVQHREVFLSTPELAGVSRGMLGPPVASLGEHRAEIVAALDLLFTGI
jgi:toxin CcdB